MGFPFFVALLVLQSWLCNGDQKSTPIISVTGKILCKGKPAEGIQVAIDLASPAHAQTKSDEKGVFNLIVYPNLDIKRFFPRISIRHKCYADAKDKEVGKKCTPGTKSEPMDSDGLLIECFTKRNRVVPKRYIGTNKKTWNIGTIELYKPGKKCVKEGKKSKGNLFRRKEWIAWFQ